MIRRTPRESSYTLSNTHQYNLKRMINIARDARTSLQSSSFLNSERKTNQSPMIKQRSGSVDDIIPGSFREKYAGDDEYFVPLADQSRKSYDAYDDHSQSSYISREEDRLSPIPPLHRNAIPANPQSPVDDQDSWHHHQQQYPSQSRRHRHYSSDSRSGSPDSTSGQPFRSRLVFTAHKRRSTFSFAVTAFCVLGFLMYGNARSTLRLTVNEIEDLVVFSEKMHRQLRNRHHDIRLLEQELTALDAMEARLEDEEMEEKLLNQVSAFANPELIQEMNIEKEKLKKAQSQADKLRSQVIALSKLDAVKKYGGGDIRIKMDLVFPTTTLEDGTVLEDTGPHSIVMEMASLDLMPHSVYTFLEMISEGLLDGCSFIINAMHVLKAAPLPYDGSPASIKAKQFSESGLESVAFKEYSPEFPHKKYTIGFAADGSPSFFINSEDNSDIHVGDPCFAKIVSGFDTVRRLDELPTRNGIWFENRVGIKKVYIL